MISLISKMAPFLKSGLSATVALSGLQRVDPKIKRFVEGSVLAGYGADSIIDFLRKHTISESQRVEEGSLQDRTAQGIARPDEIALNQQNAVGREGRQLAGQAAGLAGGVGSVLASILGGQPQTGQDMQQAEPTQMPQMPQAPQGGGVPPQQRMPQTTQQTPEEKPRSMKGLSPVAYDKTVISKAFKDSGIDKVITKMFEAGEPIQKISSYISDVYPTTAISLEKNLGRQLDESIGLFLGRRGKKTQAVETIYEAEEQAPRRNSELLASMQKLNAALQSMRGPQ